MSTGEERASKNAKTVHNESGAIKNHASTGTGVRVARADFFTSLLYTTTNITYSAYPYYLYVAYSIRAAAVRQ